MINAKEYYYVCDHVEDSIKQDEKVDHINVTPFGAGEIAGFITCDDCLGSSPEVERFFDQVSPKLHQYRFKKRKKLRAWADKQNITWLPFSKMENGYWAGQGPKPGDRIRHCADCQEAPVVFILRFELNPLDLLQLQQLAEAGEDVPDPEEAPDYVLLCGACYETLDPEHQPEETDSSIFDAEMQKDLDSKVCAYMSYDTYVEKMHGRNAPLAPEIGDVVACCDHMIGEPEFPLHYWYVENAEYKVETEDRRGRTKYLVVQWLQHCNECNTLFSGAEAVLDNACEAQFHIIWEEDDYDTFPINPNDAEDDTTEED